MQEDGRPAGAESVRRPSVGGGGGCDFAAFERARGGLFAPPPEILSSIGALTCFGNCRNKCGGGGEGARPATGFSLVAGGRPSTPQIDTLHGSAGAS